MEINSTCPFIQIVVVVVVEVAAVLVALMAVLVALVAVLVALVAVLVAVAEHAHQLMIVDMGSVIPPTANV